jgi:hypothetical protein
MSVDLYLAVGHGVEPNGVFDPGAVAADGTQEHTLCVAVTTAAAAALTRSGVSFVWESNAGAGHDPDYRGSVTQINALEAKLAVEVHFDSSNAGRGGFGIYYNDKSPGKKLAQQISARWAEAGFPLRTNYADVRGLYLLRATRCPALIWECDRTMAQPDITGLTRMGEALAKGICDFLGVAHQPPAPPVGGPVQPDFDVNILGHIRSVLVPPEGGLLQLTEFGYVYAWEGAQYHGAPGGDAAAGWGQGTDRRGAKIKLPDPTQPNEPGPHYVIIDTAGEKYNY